MRESWRNIPGTRGCYQVSDRGRVRSIWILKSWQTSKTAALRSNSQRREVVSIPIGKKWKRSYVHRLVAAAFIGPCPTGKQVNHKDGNSLNNHKGNLEYATPSENIKHAWRNGLYKRSRIKTFVCGHSTGEENVRIEKYKEFSYRKCVTCNPRKNVVF